MLIHSFWLTSFLLIASAATHAVPPIGLQPRYLPLGRTAVSLSTTTSSTTPSTPTSSAAAPTSPTSSYFFHLRASGYNPYFDDYYLTIGQKTRGAGDGDLQVMSFTPSLPPDETINLATFHLSDNNNTLVFNGLGEGRGDGKSFASDKKDY